MHSSHRASTSIGGSGLVSVGCITTMPQRAFTAGGAPEEPNARCHDPSASRTHFTFCSISKLLRPCHDGPVGQNVCQPNQDRGGQWGDLTGARIDNQMGVPGSARIPMQSLDRVLLSARRGRIGPTRDSRELLGCDDLPAGRCGSSRRTSPGASRQVDGVGHNPRAPSCNRSAPARGGRIRLVRLGGRPA